MYEKLLRPPPKNMIHVVYFVPITVQAKCFKDRFEGVCPYFNIKYGL
jgi:hypothetical protein